MGYSCKNCNYSFKVLFHRISSLILLSTEYAYAYMCIYILYTITGYFHNTKDTNYLDFVRGEYCRNRE